MLVPVKGNVLPWASRAARLTLVAGTEMPEGRMAAALAFCGYCCFCFLGGRGSRRKMGLLVCFGTLVFFTLAVLFMFV